MTRTFAVIAAVALGAAACSDPVSVDREDFGAPAFSHTGPAVTPISYAGNFVSVDGVQVCYDIAALRGWTESQDWQGFRVNLPAVNTNTDVSVTITQPTLSWQAAAGVTVLAVIVKGGPNFNLYDYVSANYTDDHDNGLRSPVNKRNTPNVSHYDVCYYRTPGDEQGCTPGYWRNHADRWVGVASSASFDATFGVTSSLGAGYTLGQAIWAQGGGENALARHATAALLNAHAKVSGSNGQFVDYPYTVAEVIQMVQDAFADETIEATKDTLAAANEAGCPLSGTPAVPVN